MSKGILGIDPGLSGGLAIRAASWVVVDPLQAKDGRLDLEYLRAWLEARRDDIECALVEEPIMKSFRNRIQDVAKQWSTYGEIRGVLAAVRIRYRTVEPKVWSATFPHGVVTEKWNKDGRDLRYRLIKQARKRIAEKLFPQVDLRESERSRVIHDGMVDALLIAEHGWRLAKLGQV